MVFVIVAVRVIRIGAGLSSTGERQVRILEGIAEARGIGLGQVNPAVRVAVSGLGGGPELVDVLAILGKERVLARLARAQDTEFLRGLGT